MLYLNYSINVFQARLLIHHADLSIEEESMKDKTAKWLSSGIIISIVIMIVGFILWTNLSPIPGEDSLSPRELRNVQKEMAIHFPLGRLLLNIGFISFSLTLLALVIRQLTSFIKKK